MKKISAKNCVPTKAEADRLFMSALKDCMFYNSRLKKLVKQLSGENFEAFCGLSNYHEDFPLRQLYQQTHSEELRALCFAHRKAQVKLVKIMFAVSNREAVLNYLCDGCRNYHYREFHLCADAIIEALRLGVENNDESWLNVCTNYIVVLPEKAALALVRLCTMCNEPLAIEFVFGNTSLLTAEAQIEMIKQCFYHKSLSLLLYYITRRENEPCICLRAQTELIRLSFETKYYDAFRFYVNAAAGVEKSEFGNYAESCLDYKAQIVLINLSFKYQSYELLEMYLQKFALTTIALEKLIDLSLKAKDSEPVLLYLKYYLLSPDLLLKIAKHGDLSCAREILKEHYAARQFEDLDSFAYLAKTFGVSYAYAVMEKS